MIGRAEQHTLRMVQTEMRRRPWMRPVRSDHVVDKDVGANISSRKRKEAHGSFEHKVVAVASKGRKAELGENADDVSVTRKREHTAKRTYYY